MILLLLLLFQFEWSTSSIQSLPPLLQEKAAREKPIIPNRLLSPSLDESIVHVYLNLFVPNRKSDVLSATNFEKGMIVGNVNNFDDTVINYLKGKGLYPNRSELVDLCGVLSSEDFPEFFPRFLCGLISIYQENNVTSLPYTRDLFSPPVNAIQFLNDPANYPCHQLNLTDVVAFVPNRIYSACMNESKLEAYSQFDTEYVMSHPFPKVPRCAENSTVVKCEMRSMIVQHKVVYQQRECCCLHDECAVLVFSQTQSLTPVILTTVDLKQAAKVPPKTTKPPTTTTPLSIDLFLWNLYGNRKAPKIPPSSTASQSFANFVSSISPISPINSS